MTYSVFGNDTNDEPDRHQPAQGQSRLGRDIQTGKYVDTPQASRRQGLYIIGIQGTGKSVLIENLIIQDIKQNNIGVCVLDPHGDLINAVLSRLPEHRVKDVIFLNITDYHYPFGINLFTCSDPTNPLEVQKIVDQVKHIFEKLLGVTQETQLILEYLYNCTCTLIANPGYTMADIPLLLQDEECRKKLVANVTDIDVQRFWRRHDRNKQADQDRDIASTLRRVRQLLQPLSRNIVGQSTSTIDIRQVMDEGKILLVKLDTAVETITELIGSLFIALLLNAAQSRADLPVNKRRQFNLYADEFQRFATEDFATLLEEARKYAIATTIAHQNRGQLDSKNSQLETNLKDRTRSAANLVMFRVNSKDAGDLAGEFDITPQPAWEEELEPERIKVLRPQRHEKIVEQVEVEVEQEIEEITQKPVDYLVSARGKHGNERVREATQAILVPLVEAAEGRGNNTQYEPVLVNSPFVPRIPTNRFDQPASPLEEVRNGKRLIDVLLVDVMEHRIELQTEAFVEKVEEIILKLSGFIGINVRPQPKYVDSFMRRFGSVFSPLLRALVFSQHHTYRLEQELSNMLIAHLTESYIASIEVAYKRATSRQNYSEKELQTEVESGRNYARSVLPEWVQAAINSLITFEGHLLTLCEALEEKPIKIGTGQKRMVKRIQPHITYLTHESEKLTIPRKTIMHPQRTYADMLNEVASQLTNLPVFTARVKITSDYGIKEHTIRTLDPKQDTDRPLFKQALEDRIASIKTQNIQNGYLRERSEVEAEIRIRQEQCSEPPEAEPPISRHPSR